MKRVLYSLLTLCLLFAGVSVKAAVGDVLHTLDEISNSKVYTIAAPRGGLVLNGAEDNACSSTNASISEAEGADQWAILKIDGQGYYLYNVAKSQFFTPGAGFSAKPKGNSRVDLMLANEPYDEDHVFKFKHGTNTLNNNNNGGFSFDSWSTEDAGNRLIITEAGDFDASIADALHFTSITFNVQDEEGNTFLTETISAITGDEVTSSFANAYAGVTLDTPSTIATDEDQVINTGYTFDESKVPFKYSESFDAATWYTMSVQRPAGKKIATFDGTNFPNVLNGYVTSGSLFAFVGGPFGYNIYNYAAGADKAVGPTTSEGNPNKLEIVDAAEAAKFLFEYSTEAGYESYQLFRYADNATAYINDNANFLGIWNSTNNRHDAGSNYIYEPVTIDYSYAELDSLITLYNGVAGKSQVGFYSVEAAEAIQAVIDSVKAMSLTEDSDIIEISCAYANIARVIDSYDRMPLEDGDYYIVNAAAAFKENQGVEKALYVETTGDFLKWQSLDRTNENQIFTIKKLESGNYTIQNHATGAYVTAPIDCSKASQGVYTAEAPADSAEQVITYNDKYGEGQFELKSTAYTISYHPESNSGGKGGSGKIVGWYTVWSDFSAWYLYKVEDADWEAIEQAKVTNALKEAIAEATAAVNEVVTYTKSEEGLVNSDASNLSSNASSLNLGILVNGNLEETTETWPAYTAEGLAYLQVDLTGKEVADIYISLAPRTGGYAQGDTPKGWTVTASNDGDNWDYITYIETEADSIAQGKLYTYPAVNLGKKYAYVRLTSPSSISGRTGRADHFALGEFQLYGATRNAIENETIAEYVANLEGQIAAAKTAVNNNTATQEDITALNKAIKDLNIIINNAPATEITEGWYAIVSAGYGPGYYSGEVPAESEWKNDENKFALFNADSLVQWKAFDRADATLYYYLTPDSNGNWYAKSLIDSTYIDRGLSAYYCDILTSTEPTTAQTIEAVEGKEGKWTIKYAENPYVYSMTASHDGAKSNESGKLSIWGNAVEAAKFGMNQWYLCPITYAEVEKALAGGGEEEIANDYWQIAEEPAAEFEAGKNYVLKNAYKNVYLSTNGGIVSSVDVLSDAEVWSVENVASEANDAPRYTLKSIAADGYWQYVNYGDQTWDEETPYDGYDWYDYAGLNAELGTADNAQIFTILPAQAREEGAADANNTVATGAQVVPNSYVIAAEKQIMGNWFKLGMQSNDAALEPWNEDVAWLFYEVTPVEDAAGALEIALAAYGQKEMKGGEYPGYYAADAVAEYNQTVANAKEALEGDDADAQRAATAALIETADKEYAINPIVDGETYFIVSAGNGPGHTGGPFNYENRFAFYNESGVVKLGDYDDTDVKYAYTFTQDADGNWNVKNIANNTYISNSDANYGQDVKTSEGLLYAQQFNLASEGKFSMTWVEERDLVCVYAINGSHNGTETPGNIKVWGTIPEAKQYGVNVWYLIPVSEDMKEKLTAIDGIAGAGEGLGVNAANGGITVSSATAQTVSVVSVSGAVVATQHVNAGETVSIQLVPGVYIVNGQKVLVK